VTFLSIGPNQPKTSNIEKQCLRTQLKSCFIAPHLNLAIVIKVKAGMYNNKIRPKTLYLQLTIYAKLAAWFFLAIIGNIYI